MLDKRLAIQALLCVRDLLNNATHAGNLSVKTPLA